jgi:hypothetical protein
VGTGIELSLVDMNFTEGILAKPISDSRKEKRLKKQSSLSLVDRF